MAMKYFNEKGIPYDQRDVMSDLKARQEMLDKSHQFGVPVLDIDGKIIVGFDKPAINAALEIN